MPSYSELMAVAGFRSKNAVYKLVQRLVAAGVAGERCHRETPSRSRLFMIFPSLARSLPGFPRLLRKS